MNILEAWKNKIVFGFYHHPVAVWPEMEDAGFSVRLFANGTLLYQTYCLNVKCEPTVAVSGRAALGGDSADRIARILAGYAKEIDALPAFTSNGSRDGTFYDFVFRGQYVSSSGIQRTDLSAIMRDNPEYYEKYRFDMEDENTILSIFTKIADAMRQDGVELFLNHLIVGGEKII